MNQHLRKIGVFFSAWMMRTAPIAGRRLFAGLLGLLRILMIPLSIGYKKIIFPVIVVLYKMYIIFGERLRTFFYAQHKILAIFTHRFALHGVMLGATMGIVSVNVIQASSLQSVDVFDGALINDFLGTAEYTVVDVDTPLFTTTHYIPVSTSLRIDQFTLGSKNADIDITPSSIAGSLVKTNTIQQAENTASVEKYTVQSGDTISSIAEEFGVSVQTILWSNNLSSTSTIKPGQGLYVLPVSGVAHTVKSGDTIASIAKKYEAKEEDIISFNNLLNAEDITVGIELVVPNGKQPAPPTPPPSTVRSGTSYAGGGSSGSGYVPPSTYISGGKLQWPTTSRSITCYYSYCYGGQLHTGIDIDGRTGDPIWAAESGYVTSVQFSNYGYGISILIQHDNGLVTRYAHLSKVYVSQGQRVSRGQTIAAQGNTGFSFGDHLHFEVIINGRTQNPLNYVQR